MIPPKNVTAAAEKLTRDLIDAGKIIEGGWVGFQLMVFPDGVSQIQQDEMRKAFFAGAAHLMASIMNVLDPEDEPTERDLRRMSLIHKELDDFQKKFALNCVPTEGNA